MNRKDRQRLDERRREFQGHKDSSNHPGSQKSLMDSYFQSQQVIQSLSAKPSASETDGPKTPEISKPFRIPRKQAQPEERAETRDIERSRNISEANDRRDTERNSYKNKRPRVDSSPPPLPPPKVKQIADPRKQIGKNDLEIEKVKEEPDNDRESEQFRAPSKPPPKIKPIETPGKEIEKNNKQSETLEESKKDVENEKIKEEPKSDEENDTLNETPIETISNTLIPEDPEPDLAEIQPVQAFIHDRSRPDGKLLPKFIPIMIQRLENMIKGTLLSGNSIVPRFLGHSCENGELIVVCLNSYSSLYLQKKIQKMCRAWPNAKLECIIKPYTKCLVTVVVPKSICHISEFIDLCKKGNKSLNTEKWIRVDHEECSDGSGRLFTLEMDSESYAMIQRKSGVVCCGDEKVEVRLKST